jgi:hypothetical protein
VQDFPKQTRRFVFEQAGQMGAISCEEKVNIVPREGLCEELDPEVRLKPSPKLTRLRTLYEAVGGRFKDS